jgi:23S rRNA (uracil1939-C5)-methyltransferase
VLALLAPGPDRVAPACPYCTRCGGCDWMHLSLEAQARTHQEHLRAALPPPWRELPIASHAAPEALAYRTRTRLHVLCERGRVEVGMHEARTHDPVVVDACVVLAPALERARRSLAPLFAGCRGKGEAQLALGAGGVPVLEVRWTGHLAPECFGRLERAVHAGELAGARVALAEASRPAVVGDPTPWMAGADGQPLRLAPGGFGQASEAMNTLLARHVAGLVRPWDVDRAVELYAGAGNLSVLLAGVTGELVLVESSREACDAARANLAARSAQARQARQARKTRVVEADAASYVWGATTKLVVLDPPRTGARPVCERLATSRVAHVVYVSCDAQTLGRDLALLAPAYRPTALATFEMFPQTSHVEAVVALERVRPGTRERR